MWYGFPILKEFSVTNLQAIVNSTSAPKWIRVPSREANNSLTGSEISRLYSIRMISRVHSSSPTIPLSYRWWAEFSSIPQTLLLCFSQLPLPRFSFLDQKFHVHFFQFPIRLT